jgi:hypothetical protein
MNGTTPEKTTSVSGSNSGSIIVKGLKNGTDYTFTVTAESKFGKGPASGQSVSVTPTP